MMTDDEQTKLEEIFEKKVKKYFKSIEGAMFKSLENEDDEGITYNAVIAALSINLNNIVPIYLARFIDDEHHSQWIDNYLARLKEDFTKLTSLMMAELQDVEVTV